MSKGVNKVILLGRLGNDPDFSQTASGVQVAKCSLATSNIWTDEQGNRQEKTEWHRLVFFRRLAEISSQYLKKGMQIYVEGELQTNKWEKDNVTRYSTSIIVREMQMLGSRQDGAGAGAGFESQDAGAGAGQSSSQGGGDSKAASDSAGETPPSYDDVDQDIPF